MAQKKYAVGIDIGGSFIKYALISDKGDVVFSSKLATQAEISKQQVLDNVVKACRRAIAYADMNTCPVEGIGVGTPGVVDTEEGIVIGGAETIVDWSDINLKDILESKYRVPVYIDNDANLMGLGESRFGAGDNTSDAVFLTVGAGVGGSVVIDHKLFGGRKNRGTELGHIPIFIDGDVCGCGAKGCLDEYASVRALVKRFKERISNDSHNYPEHIDGEVIVDLYKKNDKHAVASLNENCEFLGRGVAAYINIFSPEKVIIGGGIAEAGDFYIDRIKRAALDNAVSDCINNVEIVGAELGNLAGCMGAACLCFN